MNLNFKVGNLVETKFGKGKIVEIKDENGLKILYLIYHDFWDEGHNGNTSEKEYSGNHCWWFEEKDLTLIEPKVFTKADLKDGDICTLRNGKIGTYAKGEGVSCLYNSYIRDDLTNNGSLGNVYDIIKVERPIGYETVFERKEYKVGDKINFAGLDWFIIRTKTRKKEKLVELMLADKLPQNLLEKVFDNDDMRSDDRIKFDNESYDWKESYIREKLNSRFINIFGINRNNLVQMTTNYAEDEYTKDLVRIPSLKDCRELPKEIIKRDYWYFLINKGVYRQDCDRQPYYGVGAGVFAFNNGYGRVGTYVSFRVVLPIITVKSDALK